MDENRDILGRLDERSKAMKEDVHSILKQLERLNSKVATHQGEIQDIKIRLATAHGHWSAVNKSILIFITIIGIAVGAVATMLWH
jgi:predicted  nucleic acid-binding Zn-ribbon protein